MKNVNSLRQTLGLTQQRMAALIGVSRSLLAMYELGQRELPPKALIALSEMSRYVVANPDHPPQSVSDENPGQIQKYLNRRIDELKIRQFRVDKKIADAQKKIEWAAAQLKLMDFNQWQSKTGKAIPAPPLNLVTGDAAKIRAAQSVKLYKHSLQQQMLALEIALLEQELAKLEVK